MSKISDINNGLRLELIERLDSEERRDLSAKLKECQQVYTMTCTNCGSIDPKLYLTACKRRYCPCCAPRLAKLKSEKVAAALGAMQWPLFVTLTIPNSSDPASIKQIGKKFTEFRRTKWWKSLNVNSGVATMEVTNKGNGYHPHIHALIDCRWLAHTPEVSKQCSARENKRRSLEAAADLSKAWRLHACPESSHAVVWTKRVKGDGVVREIAKYVVKGSDLLDMEIPISPLLDVLNNTRLFTTWGSIRPLKSILMQYRRDNDLIYGGCTCVDCKCSSTLIPTNLIAGYIGGARVTQM